MKKRKLKLMKNNTGEWKKREFLQDARLFETYILDNKEVIRIYNGRKLGYLHSSLKDFAYSVEYKNPKNKGDITIYRTEVCFEDDLNVVKFKALVKANELGWNINLFSYKES